MSEPFIAEIKIFAGNFAPRGWALCDGQLLPISQNTALFSLIGTTYGGDGRTTCALPNLQGRAPMHPGNGPGLTPRALGQQTGQSTVTLTGAQMPTHNHGYRISSARADEEGSPQPENRTPGRPQRSKTYLGPPTSLAKQADLQATGGGQAHNNLQPFIVVNYIIALTGIYPSRS
ncbi:phage tail collar domain-containing protein [Haloferula helveola]|uniref:Phage tail collar domain-containing protein n=1 Tax=Haloferula helveola TaxID=490095 RepID=A0ABM7RGI2_9BACT|nr:phage tail collar domain-containing protein [Haloferula helveola]